VLGGVPFTGGTIQVTDERPAVTAVDQPEQ
jgi:hypothetical protein